MHPLTNKYDFKQIEEEVTAHWDVLLPLIHATTQHHPKKPLFSFLEGPPTANAPPGLHHVEVRVLKDVLCRYKYMQGYCVPRKGGWDCHGLPVEVQVEKKLKLTSKKQVLDYGIEKFNNECKTDVFTYIKQWGRMTKKIAYWIDLDNPYRTLDTSYVESVWWSLKELSKKGFLYEGHKVVPYCPRCETPLSSHEVALGYEDVTEDSVVVKFQDRTNPARYYLTWTTTPWTLPSNVCLAVNPNVEYAVVTLTSQVCLGGDHGKEYPITTQVEEYVLAKELVPKFFKKNPQITKTLLGRDLVGTRYIPLFPYYTDREGFVIVGEDYVSTEEGTGIVHQAPAFGEADYDSVKKHKLPFIQNVRHDGTFDDTVADFKNRFVKDADPDIIAWLERQGKLFTTFKYSHSYPFCWRCKTPLLYYALVSWFIKVSAVRDRLVELNKTIFWAPEHIRDGRFGNWLEGAKDWALSRFKFWGTPLPIWRCGACQHIEVVGSLKELNEKRVHAELEEPLRLDTVDLHKPFVDTIELTCPRCQKTMIRIPDVIDCWYDSGAAPFAQYHYPFENKSLFEKSFPYDYIAEAIDQTRGWFYTLHVLGGLLFDTIAYKKCYVGGLLCDDNGEKMSKSKGNIVLPDDVFNQYGVDAVRLLMCSYPLGENIRFGKTAFKDVVNPFLTVLWNSYYYVMEYERTCEAPSRKPSSLPIEDRWILSKVNTLIQNVGHGLDTGLFNQSVAALQTFVEQQFSRTYIKLVRDRAKDKDKALAYTLRHVMEVVVRLLAPFAPYVSEAMYRRVCPEAQSVHFVKWPTAEARDEKLERSMEVVQDILSSIHYAREKAGLGVRWPVKSVTVETVDKQVMQALEELRNLIQLQANVKTIEVVSVMPGVKEFIQLNTGTLKKEFKKDAPRVMASVTDQGIVTVFEQAPLDVQGHTVKKEHFTVTRTVPKQFEQARSTYGWVYLDKTRTPELDAEGYAREIIRRIQEMRKQAGLKKEQEVAVFVQLTNDHGLEPWKNEIQRTVGAREFELTNKTPSKKYAHSEEIIIKDLKGKICLSHIT